MIQARPPQRKNWPRVSTSEVTLDTRAPRCSSVWWAMLRAWMWLKARTRRPHRARSLAVASRWLVVRAAQAATRIRATPAPARTSIPQPGRAAGDVAVDGLLHQHRGDDPAAPGHQGQGQGEGGPLRSSGEAASRRSSRMAGMRSAPTSLPCLTAVPPPPPACS